VRYRAFLEGLTLSAAKVNLHLSDVWQMRLLRVVG
jgi:hypothetical protein